LGLTNGTLALLGSGETSAQGRKIHDFLMVGTQRVSGTVPVRVAMLETPAGFQPNADLVYRKIGEFMEKSLQNFRPQVEYMQAYRKGSAFDPDNPEITGRLLEAQYIFSGPGSPTYAARNFQGTRALDGMAQAFSRGATIMLASAAAIAAGSHTMRVYEIFKAGADLGWDNGLHLLPLLGLDVDPVIVTHWNNAEGGAGLDTTRCYMGQERFDRLMEMLPPGAPILGIDEHTACILQPGSDTFQVMGAGTITVMNNGNSAIISSGETFPLDLLKQSAGASKA
jgi:cyanophycinase-like exopeptidase